MRGDNVSSALLKQGTINADSRQSSQETGSRARMAERLAAKLPKASTIQMGAQELSEERKKIHVVKHLPKSDEELLDNLVQKRVKDSVPMRKAQKDAR